LCYVIHVSYSSETSDNDILNVDNCSALDFAMSQKLIILYANI